MIGHKVAAAPAFGWAAARCDDLVNLPASRLSALWLVAAAPCSALSRGPRWRRCGATPLSSLAQCRLAGSRHAGALGIACPVAQL